MLFASSPDFSPANVDPYVFDYGPTNNGDLAAVSGASLASNPYPKGSKDAFEWRVGWFAGKAFLEGDAAYLKDWE